MLLITVVDIYKVVGIITRHDLTHERLHKR